LKRRKNKQIPRRKAGEFFDYGVIMKKPYKIQQKIDKLQQELIELKK